MKQKEFVKWIESYTIDPEIKRQLFLMDEEEVEDAFLQNLEFGTAGLRGKLGPGSNRMNYYVVAKTTLGYIAYLKDKYPTIYEKGIAVAYDNRKFSKEFATLVANLFASEHIRVYIFDSLRPTPELSFMITELGCLGGINITASHNPKEYNGYKVYDAHGVQLLPDEANKVSEYVNTIKNELSIDINGFDNNNDLITILSEKEDDLFIDAVLRRQINDNIELKSTPVIYTPLHGAGGKILPRVIERARYSSFFTLDAQMKPDPEFTTCPSPNPEDLNAFSLAIEKANQLKVDYVLATDPDADRVGLAIRKNDIDFKLLSGNELGALLLNYILKFRNEKGLLKENSLMIDTIVTSDLGKEIARKYNLYNISVLTGFKYIGDLIMEYKESQEYQFEFGYEESLGFLCSDYVGDKDAISTSLLILEMINYHKMQGSGLLEELVNIYEEFGYFQNKQISIVLDSKGAAEKIDTVMNFFRNENLMEVANSEITEYFDYERQIHVMEDKEVSLIFDKANVIKIILNDGSWIAIRPSGTEPKLKFYIGAKASSQAEVKERVKEIQDYINSTLEELFA